MVLNNQQSQFEKKSQIETVILLNYSQIENKHLYNGIIFIGINIASIYLRKEKDRILSDVYQR